MKFLSLFLALVVASCVASPAFADSDKNCAIITQGFNPDETQGNEDYLNLTDGTAGTSRTADDEFVVPVETKFSNLYAKVDVAPGGTADDDDWFIQVMVGSTETNLYCNITGTATSCENTSAVVTAAKGSKIVVNVSSAQGTSAPELAAEMLVSFCSDN